MSQPLIGNNSKRDYATFEPPTTSTIRPSLSSSSSLASQRRLDQPTQESAPSIANASTFHHTSQISNPNDLLKSRGGMLRSTRLLFICTYCSLTGYDQW
jgi:hypothetical protein